MGSTTRSYRRRKEGLTRARERSDLLLYGAGGHAKAVLDVALRLGHRVVGLLDDNPALHGTSLWTLPILGGFAELEQRRGSDALLFLAVGANDARKKLAERVSPLGFPFAVLVHPSAQLGHGVAIGVGTVVMPQTAINADTAIGEHAIVNTGATIDHDCMIGDFAHISPGVHLAGDVRVGALAHVGIGACVIPGVTIGEGATVGAGAAVVEDVAPGKTVGGVPAREIPRRESV
jgi:sugar O-acyltransferase (sialic acid O-acetyltransferase NeuD family)